MTDSTLMNLGAWSLQVGLLTGAAAVAARLLQMDVPAARYAWWRTVLLVCLAMPVIQPWQPPEPSQVEIGAPADPAPPPVADSTRATAIQPSAPIPPVTPRRWPTMLAAALVAGAVLRLVWLATGLIRLRHVRRRGIRANTSEAPELVQSLIEAGADVRFVDSLRQPVTFGVKSPVVLLPAALQRMSPGVQRAVLMHELWHVRRRDWLWSFSEEVLRSIFWFHPAIWYLVSQVQGAREEVVDRLSVLSTNARRSYLEALLAFAEEPALPAAAPFIRRRQLFNRMMLITREGVMSPKRIVASVAVMAAALVTTGWYSALAFPLTSTEVAIASEEPREPQAQMPPRDPRADTPRPVTSREQELAKATAGDPTNAKLWLELAKLQEQRGALAEAETTLASALTATAGSREVLLAQAAFFNRAGQFEKTMQALESAAAQNPADPRGHQLVATYYWEKAQKDHSITPTDKLMYIDAGIRATDLALAQDADYVEALTYKNILLRMKGNLDTDAARRKELFAEADVLRARAMELVKGRPPARTSTDPNAPPPPPPPPPPPGYYEVDGQQAVRIGGEIPTPRKTRDAKPVHPADAQNANVSGTVIVEAVIDTQGNVRSARVLRSIPALDAAALETVKGWQFTPTVIDGVAVPVIMTVTVNFTPQ